MKKSKFKVGDVLFYEGMVNFIEGYQIKVTKIVNYRVFYLDALEKEDWIHESNLRKLTKLELALK